MKLEDMDVFKIGHGFTLDIYRVTTRFPNDERYGLTSQMRRAAVSICSNLTEGYNRAGKAEFRNFVNIARGSCGELQYQLKLSKDLEYINETEWHGLNDKSERLRMMLKKLYLSLTVHVERCT